MPGAGGERVESGWRAGGERVESGWRAGGERSMVAVALPQSPPAPSRKPPPALLQCNSRRTMHSRGAASTAQFAPCGAPTFHPATANAPVAPPHSTPQRRMPPSRPRIPPRDGEWPRRAPAFHPATANGPVAPPHSTPRRRMPPSRPRIPPRDSECPHRAPTLHPATANAPVAPPHSTPRRRMAPIAPPHSTPRRPSVGAPQGANSPRAPHSTPRRPSVGAPQGANARLSAPPPNR
jgi:hypothetical protein